MMNPKNIMKLLNNYFDNPIYNIESVINEEEKSFALHLHNLVVDAIADQLFIETYETLTYDDESVPPDAVAIEEELDNFLERNHEDTRNNKVEIDIEYKRKAVEFWHSGKQFKTVQHRYKTLSVGRPNHGRWNKN